jgi:hypothetical protein
VSDNRLRVQEPVYILATRDGAEVYRRNPPRFSRGEVAFLGTQYFAYSDVSGVSVVRLPE